MRKSRTTNRRRFLEDSLAGMGAAFLSSGYWSSTSRAASTSPNEKLQIACIGTANRAAANIEGVRGEALVACSDVDRGYLDRMRQEFPDIRCYEDYRELLDVEGPRIDAVVVSTPDHHHAPASMRALRAGLHVYCEKPLTHTVEEARLMAAAAREHGVATQMGTQIHAEENYRRVVEIVRSGAIGEVKEVHVWVGKGWGGDDFDDPGETPPPSLNWDLWLGPAQQRPFVAGRYHPAQWRRWWDFGNGTLGDMGCHYMDLPFWALDLRHPTTVQASGPTPQSYGAPMGLTVTYEFPPRAGQPPVTLTWYDGDATPKRVAGQRVPGSGVMFVGSEGKLFGDYTNYRLFPQEKYAGFELPAPSIPRSIGHYAEWIRACKEGTATTCNFDYGGALTESVLLGNVAFRTGKKIQWDANRLTVTNVPDAARLIKKEYRPGWEVQLEPATVAS
jgi:predicted dehydrogenase